MAKYGWNNWRYGENHLESYSGIYEHDLKSFVVCSSRKIAWYGSTHRSSLHPWKNVGQSDG